MNENLKFLVPKYLDTQPKLFIWDFDVAMIFMVVMGLGIVMGAFITPLVMSMVLCSFYQKMKSGRQPGYSIHLLYWYMPMNVGNRRTPPSCIRNFVG